MTLKKFSYLKGNDYSEGYANGYSKGIEDRNKELNALFEKIEKEGEDLTDLRVELGL